MAKTGAWMACACLALLLGEVEADAGSCMVNVSYSAVRYDKSMPAVSSSMPVNWGSCVGDFTVGDLDTQRRKISFPFDLDCGRPRHPSFKCNIPMFSWNCSDNQLDLPLYWKFPMELATTDVVCASEPMVQPLIRNEHLPLSCKCPSASPTSRPTSSPTSASPTVRMPIATVRPSQKTPIGESGESAIDHGWTLAHLVGALFLLIL